MIGKFPLDFKIGKPLGVKIENLDERRVGEPRKETHFLPEEIQERALDLGIQKLERNFLALHFGKINQSHGAFPEKAFDLDVVF
jgi:hypothetical protein